MTVNEVLCYFPWAPQHRDGDGGWGQAVINSPGGLGIISEAFPTRQQWLANQGLNLDHEFLEVQDSSGKSHPVPALIREAEELSKIVSVLQDKYIGEQYDEVYKLTYPSIYKAYISVLDSEVAEYEGQTVLNFLSRTVERSILEGEGDFEEDDPDFVLSNGMTMGQAVIRLNQSYPNVLLYDPVYRLDAQDDQRARTGRNFFDQYTGDYYNKTPVQLFKQGSKRADSTFRTVQASVINSNPQNGSPNVKAFYRSGSIDIVGPYGGTATTPRKVADLQPTDRIRFVYFNKQTYVGLKNQIDQAHKKYVDSLDLETLPLAEEAERAVAKPPSSTMVGVGANTSVKREVDPERIARLRVQNGQMILLRHLRQMTELASLTKNYNMLQHKAPKTKYEKKFTDIETEKLINYIGQPEALINLVNSPIRGAEHFINARNPELSTLAPRLEFFLVNKEGKRRKIQFPDHVHEHQIKKLAKARRAATIDEMLRKRSTHGTDAGIRSFSWDFSNRNVGEYVVTANLSLFFGNALDLLNDDYSAFLFTTGKPTFNAGKIVKGKIKKLSEAEKFKNVSNELQKRQEKLMDPKQDPPKEDTAGLIDRSSTRASNFPFPGTESYQLVARVGWSVPDGKLPRNVSSEFIEAIRRSQREIKLNLDGYDVDYSQNGQLTLNLSYAGSIDNALDHLVKADVLSIAGNVDDEEYEISKFIIPVPEDGVLQEVDRSLASTYAATSWPKGYIRRKSYKDYDPEAKTFNTDNILETVSLAKKGVEYELRTLDLAIRVMQEQIALAKKKYKDKAGGGDGGLNAIQKYIDPNTGEEVISTKGATLALWKDFRRIAQVALDNVMEQIREPKYAAIVDKILLDKKIYYGRITERNDQLTAGALGIVGNQRDQKVGEPTLSYEVTFTPKSPEKNESTAARKKRILNALAAAGTEGQSVLARLDPIATRSVDVDPNFGNRNIYYMRLGDIIDTVLKNLPANEEEDDDFKVILGCIYPDSLGIIGFGPFEPVCLADIPISLEYFGQFFIETVVASQRDHLSLREFLVSLMRKLLSPMFREIAKKSGKKAPVFSFTTLFSAIELDDGETVGQDELIGLTSEREQASLAKARYLVMGPRQLTLSNRLGIESEDLTNGIYHLKIGTDRGIVKNFSFSEMNLTSYYRTMQVEKSSNADGFLVVPQNIELTLYGNQFFPNGTLLYIDADVGFGRAIAKKLGIGGYYTVIRSVHTITAGKYETVLSCRFESAGNMD